MITTDLTPEQRAKIRRSYRFSAISGVVFAVVFMALAIIELLRGRQSGYVYFNMAFALFWLLMSWMNWSRFRKFSD